MLNNTFIDMLHAVASSCNRGTLEVKSTHDVTQKNSQNLLPAVNRHTIPLLFSPQPNPILQRLDLLVLLIISPKCTASLLFL
jgi:hypothetical protein